MRRDLFALWGFATLWNLISIPLVLLPFQRGVEWWSVFMLIFPCAGIYLLTLATRLTEGWSRHGQAWLALRPAQLALGEPFEARVRLEKPYPGELSIVVACSECPRSDELSRPNVIWAQHRGARLAAGIATVSFLPPEGLPPSKTGLAMVHEWGVLVRFPHPHVDERWFPVTMNSRGLVAHP